MGRVIPTRIAMVIVAAVAIFSLATWLHQVRLFSDARAAAVPARTPAQVASAAALLQKAARHTPDTLPETAEAFLLIRGHRPADGERLLRDVLRREPRNVAAWGLLALALDGRDPAGAAHARAQVARLSPPVKPAKSP
jgi:predicted Zn-dependent protease